MADFGDTIPYTVGTNTLDLSRQLEKQLEEQLIDSNIGNAGEGEVQQEMKVTKPSHPQEIPEDNPMEKDKLSGIKKQQEQLRCL